MLNVAPSLDHLAATYLLQVPLLAGPTAAYITDDSIDWQNLRRDLAPFLSHGEQLLLGAAFDLSGGSHPLSLRELVLTLDGSHLRSLVEAMFLRRDEFVDLGGV